MENRPTSMSGDVFSYGPDNLRVWKANKNQEEIFFYDPYGRRMGVYYVLDESFNTIYIGSRSTSVYFAGELLAGGGLQGGLRTDRLGSTGPTFPYGEDYTTPFFDQDDYATYYHDVDTGLEYAHNRYYSPVLGSFITPDPTNHSMRLIDPGSFNRYAYGIGDPVNHNDPSGLDDDDCDEDDPDCIGDGGCDPSLQNCGCNTDPTEPFAPGNGPGQGACPPSGGGPPPPQPPPPPPPQCSISLYERPAGGTPGNHTYLYITSNEFPYPYSGDNSLVLEGDPSNTLKLPLYKKNPWGINWGQLVGYIEAGPNYQGATNPAANQFVASDSGGQNVCTEVDDLIYDVEGYQSTGGVPYMPIPRRGYYNSNSFTFTLLSEIGLIDYFPEPPGWNPGWSRWVPGL